jgi:hypothetical protein
MKTAKHQPFPELRSDRNPFTAYLSEPRTPPTHIKTGKAKYSLRSRCGHRHHDGLRFALESTNAADMKNSFTSKVLLLLLRPSSRPSCVCFSSPARSPSTLIDRPKPSFTFPRRISLPFFSLRAPAKLPDSPPKFPLIPSLSLPVAQGTCDSAVPASCIYTPSPQGKQGPTLHFAVSSGQIVRPFCCLVWNRYRHGLLGPPCSSSRLLRW